MVNVKQLKSQFTNETFICETVPIWGCQSWHEFYSRVKKGRCSAKPRWVSKGHKQVRSMGTSFRKKKIGQLSGFDTKVKEKDKVKLVQVN